MFVHTGREAFFAIDLQRISGHRHDRNPRIEDTTLRITDPPAGLVTVHHRHLAIHEDEIVGAFGQNLDRFLAVGDDIDLEPEFSQHAQSHGLVGGIILDHQYPCGKARLPMTAARRGDAAFFGSDPGHL